MKQLLIEIFKGKTLTLRKDGNYLNYYELTQF